MLFIAFNNFTNNPAATNNTPTSNQAPTSGWAALAQVGANVTASVLNQRQQNQLQQNQAQRNLVEPAGNNPVYSSMINSALPSGFRETFPGGAVSPRTAPTTLLEAVQNLRDNPALKFLTETDNKGNAANPGFQALEKFARSGENPRRMSPAEMEKIAKFKDDLPAIIGRNVSADDLQPINDALARLNFGTIQQTGLYATSGYGFSNGGWTGAIGSVLGGLGDWMRTRRS